MIDWDAVAAISASFHTERVLHPRDNSCVRASSIGECRRKIAYRIQWHRAGKDEGPLTSHLLAIFDVGHALHNQLQMRFSNVGPLQWIDADPAIDAHGRFGWAGNCELDLQSPVDWYAGHCDGLTRPLKRVTRKVIDGITGKVTDEIFLEVAEPGEPGAKRFILDIKTITARQRWDIDSDPQTGQIYRATEKPSPFERLTKMKDEHRAQVSLYCHAVTRAHFGTDREPGPLAELPGIMLIYAAKDLAPDYYRNRPRQYPEGEKLMHAPFKVFTEDADPRLITALLKKIQGIKAHVEAGTLPPRDFHHTPERPAWACVDCPFRHDCYQEEGYFAGETLPVPARLQHELAMVDEGKKVLG